MKINFTFCAKYSLKYFAPLLLLLFFSSSLEAQVSTKVYATSVVSSTYTTTSASAVDANLATSATVSAGAGLVAGIGGYSGYVELSYPTTLPANTTSYVKIQTQDNLLPTLLGGSLGGVLSSVLGGVLIGNQEFTIQAKDGNTVLLQGESQQIGEFATERLRVVTDQTGDFYIAITPAQPYNRIRVRNRLGSLLGLFNTRTLQVFESFYVTGFDDCGLASYTAFSGDGTNLDLLNLGNVGVTNPQNAIDGNLDNFSQLSLGVLAVGASIQQTVYFNRLTETNEEFNIRLKVDPSLLALGVGNTIQIIASNGTTVVETRTMNSLLNLDLLTLLQGNQTATIPFAPILPADRITVRYSSLLNVQLTQSLGLYEILRVPKPPTISSPATQNAIICSGTTASLTATTAAVNQVRWYSTATGGTPLETLSSGTPYVTTTLNASTTFYAATIRTGCTQESRRVPVTVQVIATPTAADITIPSVLTACQGNITLSPTSTIGAASMRYYTDQNKTQEIVTGFTGNPGVTYVKNPTTGALTITGLTAANSPYNYYVSITVNGLCENTATNLKQVTVNYSNVLTVQVASPLAGCGSVNLRNAITNFDPSITYAFFNAASAPISQAAASNITTSGNYFIQALNPGSDCISSLVPVAVTVNTQPTLTIANSAIVTQIGNTVTLNATAATPIVWYNAAGTALGSNIAGPFATPGTYTFTAITVLGSCSASGSITVTVLDPAGCPPLTERNFADTQRWGSNITGNVTNPGNAIDGNLQTFSTITTGLGLLGIGTTWQILEWNQTIAAGTPVTLKLGSEYSGVTLAGGYSVVGTKRNGSGTPVDVGNLQQVSGSLLNLLPGQNNFEYTFVPSNGTGPQAYDGVRIVVSSLISVAQSAKVYEAYYDIPATQIACGDDAEDVLFGAIDLGIGALTATVGVDSPFNAIDVSPTTFATMFTGVGILAASELNVVFRTPSIVGDSLKIRISRPGTLLTANVLSGLTVQPLLNDALAGPEFSNTSLVNLQLLGGGSEAIITLVPTQSFDKIRIRFGGAVNALDFLRIHDVERVANTHIDGADDDNAITACQGETITLEATSIPCTTFVWYDAAVGGNVISTGNSYTIPANLPQGIYTYYIQPVRFGCESLSRGTVKVTVRATAPVAAITSVLINGGTDTTFCSPTGAVSLNAILNTTPVLTTPVFYWYSFDGTTQTLIPSQSGATLALTGLTPGTYTYYVGVSAAEFCQTAPADRDQVTFTIYPSSIGSDIQAANDTVCLGSTAQITPISPLVNPVFSYYLTNNTTQPIANGAVINGATYTIASNGSLSITGLLQAGSPYTYFIAVTSDTTCLNAPGTLLAVTVTVGNPGPPTTDDNTQVFCISTNPTVANIQVTGTGVIFYDAPVGGNVLPPTTLLQNGIYYAAQVDGDCESDIRLAITITLGNPNTPTTNNLTQNFCQINNPTFANIQVNETGVVFYDEIVGGNLIPSTTPLTAGTYYAVIQSGTCESDIRLAIVITISNPTGPTTDSAAQTFCQANNPTVADLDVNESNLVFYNVPTGGTPLALTEPLAAGIYYVSLIDVTGCESINRLAITVSITTVGPPTAVNTTQEFCQANNPTVANIVVNQANIIFYDAPTGGNPYAANAPLMSGIYYASILSGICESETRLAITINVNDPATPTTNNSTQNFCQVNNPTFANIQVNETGVLFYDALTGGNLIASTTPLTAGTYYAVLQNGTCQSSIRLAITVTISNPGPPTTLDNTQEFCQSENPTVADIQVNQTNVVFYPTATGGTAYLPTDALANGIYYAALVDAFNCESVIRLAITVTTTAVGNPTTTNNSQTFCLSNNATVANIQVNETGVVFFDAPTGGNLLPGTTPLSNGIYYATLQNGLCESDDRLAITVTIFDPATPTTNDSTQNFCQVNNPTFANIQVNEVGVLFYDALTGGNLIASTTPLTAGTYYAVLQNGTCQSSIRLAITVTISNPGPPTTLDNTQEFCQSENPTVADIQVNQTNVVFYPTATGGTAYLPTDALANGIYYAALVDALNCESVIRLAITVTTTAVGNPTTTNNSQTFCLSNNATVANIQVNETGVVFFDAPTGGNLLPGTTPLSNGVYYATLQNGLCESDDRLAITVTIVDSSTPTTTDTTQDFCQAQNPTVANLQVNETGVVFYTTLNGGTALAPTTPLVNGVYYASIQNGTCQSINRLAITVTVINVPTPTTGDATQQFCQANNPTVANIQVNEANLVFYSAATGGTPIAPTTPLVAGTYYVAITNGICESSIRLAIAVTFFDTNPVQITGGGNQACLSETVTYTTVTGMSNYVWTVTSGLITGGGQSTDNFVTVLWNNIGTGNVNVSFTNASGCSTNNSASRTIALNVCSDIMIFKTVNNPTPMIDDTVVFTIEVENSGSSIFTGVVVSEQLPSGYQYISSTTSVGTYSPSTWLWTIPLLSPGQVATLTVTVKVLSTGNYMNMAYIDSSTPIDSDITNNSSTMSAEPLCLTVYNEFSPNNDGNNDLFRIDCIENYPNNTLNVYNRYGVEVYRKRAYLNDWDGTANVNSPVNQDNKLPTGTYYYTLDLGDGTGAKTGWIYITR